MRFIIILNKVIEMNTIYSCPINKKINCSPIKSLSNRFKILFENGDRRLNQHMPIDDDEKPSKAFGSTNFSYQRIIFTRKDIVIVFNFDMSYLSISNPN